MNELASALVRADAPSDTAMGVIPLGTANDFATGLGIPEVCVRAILPSVNGAHPRTAFLCIVLVLRSGCWRAAVKNVSHLGAMQDAFEALQLAVADTARPIDIGLVNDEASPVRLH